MAASPPPPVNVDFHIWKSLHLTVAKNLQNPVYGMSYAVLGCLSNHNYQTTNSGLLLLTHACCLGYKANQDILNLNSVGVNPAYRTIRY